MPISEGLKRLAEIIAPTKEAADRLDREWAPDAPPDTITAASLARAFAASVDALSLLKIQAVVDMAEALLKDGDERTQTAIATGFFEALMAQASAGTLDFRKIAWALGDESRKYCRAWDTFTGVKTDGLWNGGSRPN